VSFKTRIKELRARYDMTQADLAKKVGVRRETISFLERGKYNPSLGRSNNPMSMLSKVLLVALAPTVLFVAIIELIVVPIWGARTAFSLVPFGFFIWLVSATLLIKRKW